MKRYYRPRTLGAKINHGEATYYVVLDDSLFEELIEPPLPVHAMHTPISRGGLSLVVNNR